MWKNVTGDRILIRSNNPDVQTQAFRDGNKLYIAMNNLDDFTQNINLNFDNVFGSSINDVRIKSVIVNPNETLQFSDQTYTAIPSQYQLAPNETIVLEYNYDTNFEFNSTITSNRYYDDVVVQEIIANNPINYNFSSVTTLLRAMQHFELVLAENTINRSLLLLYSMDIILISQQIGKDTIKRTEMISLG